MGTAKKSMTRRHVRGKSGGKPAAWTKGRCKTRRAAP